MSSFYFFTNIRSHKKYKYESLITGEIQDERPAEEDEEEIEELKNIEALQGSGGTQDISLHDNLEKSNKNGQNTNLIDVTSKQHEYPQASVSSVGLSPTPPFPPLPPLPPEDTTNKDTSGPPLPTEDNPSDLAQLSNQPPPPPPEALPSEKSEQYNTSTSQVEHNISRNLYDKISSTNII